MEENPDLFRAIEESGHPRPEVYLETLLNMDGERKVLNNMEETIKKHVGSIGSYEHDGTFVWLRKEIDLLEILDQVQKRSTAPIAIKKIPIFSEKKTILIEIGIVTGLLLIGGIVEMYMIEMAQSLENIS